MGMIPDQHKEHMKQDLQERLEKPVKILMFTQELECKFCGETRQLIGELAALNDKIKIEILDFIAHTDEAKKYSVDKVPALVILGEKDYGIRFYGLPYGYEFQTLIEALATASRGRTDLAEQTKQKLQEVKTPVHIQVFVTLTCPYCAVIASMAHKFALENSMIRADVIDANEFPQLAVKYGIMGVPKTIINDKKEFVGLVPENIFLEHVLLGAQ